MLLSLPARGVWVEIMCHCRLNWICIRHSPRGECGLKSGLYIKEKAIGKSLPARGVWVEIDYYQSAGCALESLPARGVWVEIEGSIKCNTSWQVTPREGSVGWNLSKKVFTNWGKRHSPRGECGLKSADRAIFLSRFRSLPARGVWVEMLSASISSRGLSSLPARGVWVEIGYWKHKGIPIRVTPREGSVGWNC